jgi:hypothetical protein
MSPYVRAATLRRNDPLTPAYVAVMSASPTAIAEASPEGLTVRTAVFDDCHDASVVMAWVDPFESEAVAVN